MYIVYCFYEQKLAKNTVKSMYVHARQASGCLNGKESPLSIAAIEIADSTTIFQPLP